MKWGAYAATSPAAHDALYAVTRDPVATQSLVDDEAFEPTRKPAYTRPAREGGDLAEDVKLLQNGRVREKY